VIGTEPVALIAAVVAAIAAATGARLALSPPRPVGRRIRPYVQVARARLGAGDADAAVLIAGTAARNPFIDVFAPIGRRLATILGRLIDAGDRSSLETRLRHAGYRTVSVDDYRMRQLGWTVGGAAAGVGAGLVFGLSTATVLALGGLLAYFGASRWRGRVDHAIRDRRSLMRAELSTVAQLLAVHVRAGRGPVEAVREVVGRGRGPVTDELREALGWIGGGMAPGLAYERLAQGTAEPLAARLYRALGWATTSGGDVTTALLRIADDVRAERRDELARTAIRRRSAMLIPLLALIAPTMLLFVAAALPHIIFGQ
jgi:tight adherence protein C